MGLCLEAVDTHTAGEPTRVVVRGVDDVPGTTMQEKKRYLAERMDHIRKLVVFEPRGHRDMFGAILLRPTSPDAHLGVVFLEGAGYLDMCIHGTMGVVRAAIEIGLVPLKEPVTSVILDTPAGLVEAEVQVHGGKVAGITVTNVPSFVYGSFNVELPSGRTVRVGIAYGGNFFALVRARDLGLEIEPARLAEIRELGRAVRSAVAAQVELSHPDSPSVRYTPLVEFYEDADAITGAPAKNVVFFGADQIDRSPCGTGTCAKMAWMYEQGDLGLNQEFVHQSILGTKFVGRLVAETTVGPYRAVIPQVTGNAFVMGHYRVVLEDGDPFPNGFLL